MDDESHSAQPTPQPPVPAVPAASAVPAAAADTARAQRLARRLQLRENAARDAPEQERRRLKSIAAKAATREARRAAALTAQAGLWRSFGPAQQLFTDGIASCLGFLSLADFLSAAQTCKGWRAGAHAVKSLGHSDVTGSMAVLPSLIASPFRRLIKSFVGGRSEFSSECSCSECLAQLRFSEGPAQLTGLYSLVNLTSLQIGLDLAKFTGAAQVQYPPLLFSARLKICRNLSNMDDHESDAASVLRGLISCASLTRLDLELLDDVSIALTALGAIKQLRHLSIDGFVESHYTPATLLAIKSLPLLETLSLQHTNDQNFNENADVFDPEWLTPLLTSPHQLQTLESFDTDCFYLWDNDFYLLLLPSLTSLTELKPNEASVVALPALAAFKKLRVLHLSFDSSMDFDLHEDNEDLGDSYDDHGCARLSLLVPHLTHCSLTELSVTNIACDGDSLATLCKSHSALKTVMLNSATLPTVEPLSTLPQLTQLTVDLAPHADPLPALFEHICACQSLQQLSLTDIAPALSEAQQHQLRPPSTVLPLLQSFEYSSRS